jgi:hypothetical protein
MDKFKADEAAGPSFALKAHEPVAVRQDRPVRGTRRVNRRNLGSFEVNGSKINVWFERGRVIFRKRYSHRTEVASLQDIYHRTIGQGEFRL